ncbi:hypothetical protein M514_19233 [Trichuris suis]|uniref:Uncharacterized protein n=1 Tax=Trichuris suis TaxID=68888 RepID=A0A085NGK4_9BILA|nr:hypothetical protein M513_00328 [Trichuris suis]KFD58636.1 hypothetical protein M513_00329 [Trichuris suis]KFD68600.1 hypothetical protein M514_19233 [Trichuris suis]
MSLKLRHVSSSALVISALLLQTFVAPLKNIDYLNENVDADKYIEEEFDVDGNDMEPDVATYVALSCMLGIYMILTSITIMAAAFCYDWFVRHLPFANIRKICMGIKETEMESPFYKFVENSVRLASFEQRKKLTKQEKQTKSESVQDSASLSSEDSDETDASTGTGDDLSKSTSVMVGGQCAFVFTVLT